jgi:hypothetical protein
VLTDARARGIALVLVSNEVGMGVVPAYPLGRRYRDGLGRLNQAVAARSDPVLLVVAGLAIDLRRLALPAPPPAPFARSVPAGGRGARPEAGARGTGSPGGGRVVRRRVRPR